ncbi:hypothetical protein LSH36_154g13000 [Paralvinella palmiformis]|uniref:Kindlin-2 N-terminal domain-containing protein n=1 Tax=Paralvinella palmiformis TaxID=53620 RepID=A0AAD9N8X6_9ANNE|nr:hypothetical protein LSH36_154g13000 [Paralvinella palmiformis]
MWLLRTRSTLDQYNVQADAHIWFTPMHKNLRVQLPDLQVMDMRVNFSSNVFSNVIKLCKEFGMYRVNISPLYFIISLGHRSLLLEIVSAILMSVIDIFYVIQGHTLRMELPALAVCVSQDIQTDGSAPDLVAVIREHLGKVGLFFITTQPSVCWRIKCCPYA